MPTPTHTTPIIIHGSTDDEQLVVQGSTTPAQMKALQEWRKDATTLYGRVTNDGRLQLGTFSSGTMDTDDSLIEAHRGEDDTTKPKRGLHLMGVIKGALSDVVSWVVHELTLKGTSISAVHSALRVRLRSEAVGATGNAELRGGDIEVINAATSGTMPTVTGLRVAVVQETGADADAVYGLKVELTDTLEDPFPENTTYAVYANAGKVRFGGLSAGLVHANSSGDLTSTLLAASDVSNGAITLAKLADGPANQLIGFDANGTPAHITAPTSGSSMPLVITSLLSLNANSQYFSRRLRLTATGKLKLTATTLFKGV